MSLDKANAMTMLRIRKTEHQKKKKKSDTEKSEELVNFRLLWWLSGRESTCNAGDVSLIPGLGRSPGEGNGNPFHYSCLENPMDRGAWWATFHGVAEELDITEQLSLTHCCIFSTE